MRNCISHNVPLVCTLTSRNSQPSGLGVGYRNPDYYVQHKPNVWHLAQTCITYSIVCTATYKMHPLRNERIRGTAKVGEIPKRAQESRLKWYGHVLRREDEYVGRRVMAMEVPGKRRRGRPKRRWLDNIRNDLSERIVRAGNARPGSMEASHKNHRPPHKSEKRCGRRIRIQTWNRQQKLFFLVGTCFITPRLLCVVHQMETSFCPRLNRPLRLLLQNNI